MADNALSDLIDLFAGIDGDALGEILDLDWNTASGKQEVFVEGEGCPSRIRYEKAHSVGKIKPAEYSSPKATDFSLPSDRVSPPNTSRGTANLWSASRIATNMGLNVPTTSVKKLEPTMRQSCSAPSAPQPYVPVPETSDANDDATCLQDFSRYYAIKPHMDDFLSVVVQRRGDEPKKATISLRLFDFFCTNYCRDNTVTVAHPRDGKRFDVYASYKKMLQFYKKKRFDCFCRAPAGPRIKFTYDKGQISTNIAQLRFFRWAIENGVFVFVKEQAATIDVALRVFTTKSLQIRAEKKRKCVNGGMVKNAKTCTPKCQTPVGQTMPKLPKSGPAQHIPLNHPLCAAAIVNGSITKTMLSHYYMKHDATALVRLDGILASYPAARLELMLKAKYGEGPLELEGRKWRSQYSQRAPKQIGDVNCGVESGKSKNGMLAAGVSETHSDTRVHKPFAGVDSTSNPSAAMPPSRLGSMPTPAMGTSAGITWVPAMWDDVVIEPVSDPADDLAPPPYVNFKCHPNGGIHHGGNWAAESLHGPNTTMPNMQAPTTTGAWRSS
jgi:hypothetical protein